MEASWRPRSWHPLGPQGQNHPSTTKSSFIWPAPRSRCALLSDSMPALPAPLRLPLLLLKPPSPRSRSLPPAAAWARPPTWLPKSW